MWRLELKECYLNASCVQCEMYLEDCLCSGNFHFPYDPFNSDFDDQDSNQTCPVMHPNALLMQYHYFY